MFNFVFVVLKLSGLTVPQILQRARFIVQCLNGNSYFPSPAPVLSAILAAIAELDTAENNVTMGIRGAVSIRDAKLRALKQLLGQERSYVETTANLNPALAEGMVYSAGMEVKTTGGRKSQSTIVTNTIVSGVVELYTIVFRGAVYEWFMTETPADDNSWVRIGLTHQARLVKTGLTPGKKYYFKVITYLAHNNDPVVSVVISIIVL